MQHLTDNDSTLVFESGALEHRPTKALFQRPNAIYGESALLPYRREHEIW
jgi:hypothetical protein